MDGFSAEARTAAALFESLDDRLGWLQAAGFVADSELSSGRPAAAIDQLHRILTVMDGDGLPASIVDIGRAVATARLGRAYRRLGQLPDAADCFTQAAAQLGAQGVLTPQGRTEEMLAEVLLELADPDGAAAAYGRAAEAFDAAGAGAEADRVRALATAPSSSRPAARTVI